MCEIEIVDKMTNVRDHGPLSSKASPANREEVLNNHVSHQSTGSPDNIRIPTSHQHNAISFRRRRTLRSVYDQHLHYPHRRVKSRHILPRATLLLNQNAFLFPSGIDRGMMIVDSASAPTNEPSKESCNVSNSQKSVFL